MMCFAIDDIKNLAGAKVEGKFFVYRQFKGTLVTPLVMTAEGEKDGKLMAVIDFDEPACGFVEASDLMARFMGHEIPFSLVKTGQFRNRRDVNE